MTGHGHVKALEKSNSKLPRFEFVKIGNEIEEFLDSLVEVGKISIVKIYDKEYLVYAEKTERISQNQSSTTEEEK